MRRVSFDLETHIIQPGLLTPPIVCGSSATAGTDGVLLGADDAVDLAASLLADPEVVIVGANVSYDMGCLLARDFDRFVLPMFAAYEAGRVRDILIAQALDAIARGNLFRDPRTGGALFNNGKATNRYSLNVCVDLTMGRTDAKENDFWRLRYAMLQRLPVRLWPYEAQQYPKDDAVNTLRVDEMQADFRNAVDHEAEVFTDLCLQLGAIRGLRTCRDKVGALKAKAEAARAETVAEFTALGLIREAGTVDQKAVKARVARAYGATEPCAACGGSGRPWTPCRGMKKGGRFQGCLVVTKGTACGACGSAREVPAKAGTCEECDGSGLDLSACAVPRSKGGGICCDRDALAESGDEELHRFGDNEPVKILGTYVPYLEQGFDVPICLSPNVLVDSTRTSYSDVIQQLPKEGGIRECFISRDDYYFCSVDFAAVELCSLAQVCLYVVGKSRMAEVINETKDPGALHTALGARMLGVEVDAMKRRIKAGDKVAADYRQAAKAPNFGFPGGMGAARMVLTNRKKSVGTTTGPDGRTYAGIRFCILVGGARECGTEKVTEWNRKTIPPTCKACLELVQHQLKPAYFAEWPEVSEYHAWVKAAVDVTGGVLPFFGKQLEGCERGGLDFCNGANNGFQALAAAGAKRALRQVTREAYTDRDSVLYGKCFPIIFVHDEIISEVDRKTAHLVCPRKADIMVASMREYLPDIFIEALPAISTFLSKGVKTVYDSAGRLIPWQPKN